MKAVDYFMLTSFGFIFTALVEYIIVLNTPEAFSESFNCFEKKQKNEPVQVQVTSIQCCPWNNTNELTHWHKFGVRQFYCDLALQTSSYAS